MAKYQCSKCKKMRLRTLIENISGVKIYEERGYRIYGNICSFCVIAKRKARMASGKHKETMIRYERTPNGFLMRLYRNMKSRVLGIQKQKAHLYEGKELLPKEEFYAWAKSKKFYKMYAVYCDSGRDRRLAPTVDRIDSSLGYTVSNMRWLTHSENSRLGSLAGSLALASRRAAKARTYQKPQSSLRKS